MCAPLFQVKGNKKNMKRGNNPEIYIYRYIGVGANGPVWVEKTLMVLNHKFKLGEHILVCKFVLMTYSAFVLLLIPQCQMVFIFLKNFQFYS